MTTANLVQGLVWLNMTTTSVVQASVMHTCPYLKPRLSSFQLQLLLSGPWLTNAAGFTQVKKPNKTKKNKNKMEGEKLKTNKKNKN